MTPLAWTDNLSDWDYLCLCAESRTNDIPYDQDRADRINGRITAALPASMHVHTLPLGKTFSMIGGVGRGKWVVKTRIDIQGHLAKFLAVDRQDYGHMVIIDNDFKLVGTLSGQRFNGAWPQSPSPEKLGLWLEKMGW